VRTTAVVQVPRGVCDEVGRIEVRITFFPRRASGRKGGALAKLREALDRESFQVLSRGGRTWVEKVTRAKQAHQNMASEKRS